MALLLAEARIQVYPGGVFDHGGIDQAGYDTSGAMTSRSSPASRSASARRFTGSSICSTSMGGANVTLMGTRLGIRLPRGRASSVPAIPHGRRDAPVASAIHGAPARNGSRV